MRPCHVHPPLEPNGYSELGEQVAMRTVCSVLLVQHGCVIMVQLHNSATSVQFSAHISPRLIHKNPADTGLSREEDPIRAFPNFPGGFSDLGYEFLQTCS